MDVEKGVRSQGGTQLPSHPAGGARCLGTAEPGAGRSLAGGRGCERAGWDGAATLKPSEQEGCPLGNPTDFGKDGSASSAAVGEGYPEEIPSGSEDCSDDNLEYFECSDVLTAREDELWREKLRFLLESDDEGDPRLSQDCDGCAYFLRETPGAFRVSGDTAPVDTPIGLCGHHSRFKGVDVRRDPWVCSRPAPQAEMTLAVGHHRDRGSAWEGKEQSEAPVAAAGNEHPGGEGGEGASGSGHLAAGSSGDTAQPPEPVPAEAESSARGTGAAWPREDAGTTAGAGTERESSLLPEEEGGSDAPEGNAGHAVCTFTESLRRNLFKLLNPVELCRYVSALGQSFQAAAEGREAGAPSPSQEGVLSTQIPGEAEGLCQAEGADKDCHWERERTRGPSERNQVPAENVSLGNQGADLKSVTQNCEDFCMEPRTDGIFRACESAGTSQPAAELLPPETTLPAKNAHLQTSPLPCAPWDEREGSHPEVFSGQEMISDGSESKGATSASPSRGAESVPDKQECLCAVLSSAKLCDEPRSGSDPGDSSAPEVPCSPSGEELALGADPEDAGCGGDADVSAAPDHLQKLLHEDDSECQIPSVSRGITSLATSLTDLQVPALSSVHPLPTASIREQEPEAEPALSAGNADPGPLLRRAGAWQGASTGNICLAHVGGEDGGCVDGGTGNEMEAPSICASGSSGLRPGQCLEPSPAATDRSGSAVAWEGKPPVHNAAQAGSPQRLQSAPADASCGTAGQSLPTEHNISWANESVPGEGCHVRGCSPVRPGLAYFPEEKDIFPRENTCQLPHAEHSSVNTVHKSYEVNLPEEGNRSDSSTQTGTNPDSCHLSEVSGCQGFQVVSSAQKCSSVMQLPTLIKTPETVTHKNNPPQNTDQLTEAADQAVALAPSSKDPLLSDFYLEVPSCEPGEPGGEQPEIHTAAEHGAEPSWDPAVGHASESQAAVCPCYAAEQGVCFVDSTFGSDEELKMGSSKYPTCASWSLTSASTLLPRKAPGEHQSTAEEDRGAGHQSDSQQLPGTETLLLLSPGSHSEGLLPSSSAEVCPGPGGQVKTGSSPTGARGNRSSGLLEASRGLFQRVPAESKGDAALGESGQESPRAVEWNLEEADTEAPLHAFVSSQAQRQMVTNSTGQPRPELIPSSEVTEADHSMKSTEHGKEEEVRTAESAVSALVDLPVASGSSQCFQEQRACSRAQPLSLALATCDPFPVSAGRQRTQEGSNSCQTPAAAAEPEPIRCKQDTAKCGHFAAGAKKKLPSAALSKKPRLEEKGSVSKDPSCVKKPGKSESGIRKEDRKEQRKLILKKDSKAPRLLRKIQAELFPERSGSVKLCCQFGDVHADSTVTWTKDAQVLARLHRSAQDDSPVPLEIPQASSKDQGMYHCCLSNLYGKVTAEFHLTAAVLERLSSSQSYEGVEEIEFMQLLFREDSLSDSYFGGALRGALSTEERHFGEGMHRRAFRSRVRRGLAPVFAPGHPCVLKVHSALAHGAGGDELARRSYNLALQECCIQNAAREYAKRYAAEAETLEGFGEVPEIIPIFLIHRPANTIPYATVEEELVGEFVKYSVRDGKEVNFLRRDSEAGQKCCTFQHWVYEQTSGNLLVTDLQGVGMKLTDVGIATLAKGYKGFKGNCSFSFIEQFRALHQCNEYCEMLGLKSLRAAHQKQRKAAPTKGKTLPNSSAAKKMVPKKAREHRDFISSEH